MFQHKKYLNKYNIHYLFLFCKCPKRHTHKIQSKIHRFVFCNYGTQNRNLAKIKYDYNNETFFASTKENAMFREKQSLFFATKKV